MGFSLVSTYNPEFGQLEIIAQVKFLLAFTLFLILNGHLKLLEVLVRSYEVIPLGEAVFSASVVAKLVAAVGLIFEIAFKIGGPVILVLWITSIALGLLVRLIPQMNIFMVDFPLKVGIGLFSLAICLPSMAGYFRILLGKYFGDLPLVLTAMKG